MEQLQLLLKDTETEMMKVLDHAHHELNKIRAGKANPSLLEDIKVLYYGTTSPLSQVASITTPDARSLFIKPWEKGLIPEIEKAILAANLGFTPQNDGQQIIINIPTLTEERRKQLIRQAAQACEQSRVSVRNVRKESNERVHTAKDSSEDEMKNAEEDVQKLTNEFIKKIDELLKKKEVQIMTL